MAAADKLWFELGVRDEISGVLETLMRNSERLANALSDDAAELKNVYKNIVDVSNVYDKIYVAQKRISELKGSNLTREEKKGLKDMKKELEDVRKQFAAIFKNPDRLLNKGEVQFDKMRLNIELMLKDVLRYVDNIEAKEAAEAKNAVNESKRIDDLKGKYYELQRYRKQLSDAIINSAPGADLTSASSLINSISARMGAVSRAQSSGKGLPASVTGADYEEFLRKVKAELNELTGATSDYNSKLEQNKQIQASLNKLKLDTVSQQSIAGIRKQSSEYTALGRKIQEIIALINNVQAEQAGIANGSITNPTWTRDKVTEELNAIQRRYNEALAAGRQRELDDAAAKNQKTAATRKAMEAVSALAHVNQGLVSSYNRVAEAGSQANRITVQFQNQIGAYAGLYGLERILKSIVTIGGQFEVQHVALQNILGDVQEANILFGQLKELAIESPKTFMELTSYAKQLSAYQIPANELYETTKRLADMSSGLGVDMNRLILAYGQVRSAAVLRGQELRQFTEAGIPMVQALADKFTQLNGKLTTTADVFKLISARAVPFEMVKEVLWDMTSQGGQFFNMQEELANTLYGKWQKLQDSWQIMLGSIAEGTNASGMLFKWLLDIAVALTQNLDKMVFAFSALGAAKGIKLATEGLNNAVMRRTGDMAIRNMELAKIQEANRLERERLWNGRQLSAEEQQLVMNKNRLVSSDYQILALENQITAKKAHQLMLDGKMSQQHFYRYLQMQGYTREQRKQIALGNLQALNQGPNPQKLGIMGHLFGIGAGTAGSGLGKFLGVMGGWVGVAITALGVFTTIYEFISQSDERLSDLASSISGSAEQNANQLANTLKNVESSADEPFKKVEALEDALLKMGVAGKQVVQDSRGFDDINERLENLTKNAQAYQQALEAMGTPQGKTAIMEALDNSDLNDELDEYDDLQNAEYKRMAALERYSAKYQQMIDAMKTKHKELNDELTSNNLYDNIRKLMTGSYANEAVGYFAGNTPWGEAITDYAKAVEESEAHLENIKNNVIPDAMNELRALARQAGVDINKSYDQLTEEEKTKLRTIATNFANGLEKGSQDAKNSIASWVAQGFYAQLYLTPVLNVNDLTGLAYTLDQWQSGKGYGLWNKNDLKDANNNFLAFSKKQSQRKVDLEKTVKNFDSQLKNTLLRPDLIPTIQGQRQAVQAELDQLNASLSEGLWTFDKSLTKGNKGGSKTDQVAKEMREQIKLVKEAYSWYKKYKDDLKWSPEDAFAEIGKKYGDVLSQVGVNWDAEKGDITDYSESLRNLLEQAQQLYNQPAHKNSYMLDVIKELKDALQQTDFDDKKEALQHFASEVELILKNMGEQWTLYKSIRDATGSREIASRLAGTGGLFNNMADALKSRIGDMVGGKSIDFNSVLNMDDKAIKDYVAGLGLTKEKTDGIINALKQWRDLQRNLLNESITAYSKMLTDANSLKNKLDAINSDYKDQIDYLNTLRGNGTIGDDEYSNRTAQSERTRKMNLAEALVNGVDWSTVSQVYGNILTDAAEQLKKELDKIITGEDFKKMNVTEQKRYIDLRSQLDANDGTVTSPFNISAWKDATDHLQNFQTATQRLIRATIDYEKALQDEEDASKALANAKNAEEQASAQAALNAARDRKTDASGRMTNSQKEMQKEGQEFLTAEEKAAKGLEAFAQGIQTLSSGKLADFVMGIDAIISAISETDASKTLSGAVTSILESVGVESGNIYGMIIAAVIELLDAIGDDAGGFVGEIVDKVFDLVTGIIDDLFSGELLEKIIQAVARGIGSLISSIAGALNPKNLISIPTGIIGGFFSGLGEGLGLWDSDEDLQEEIEASQRQVEVLERIHDLLEKKLEYALGGVYRYSNPENTAQYQKSMKNGWYQQYYEDQLNRALEAQQGKRWIFNQYSWLSTDALKDSIKQLKDAVKAFQKANETGEYYDQQRALLYAQRFELESQLANERDKKDSDAAAIENYKNQIEELDFQIKNFALDMANSLYGIDLKSWASELTDAVVSAWEAGENAEEAYLKKGKEIIKDLAKTIMQQKIMEIAFKNAGLDDLIANMMDSQSGKLNYDNVVTVGNVIQKAGGQATEAILAILDYLESTGAIEKGDEGSSASNSIRSISETAGDLIASYVNGMRADLSAHRATVAIYYPQFLTAMQQGNVIADAQLAELRNIVANTRRNIELVENIYNILHGVAPDGQSIKVK